MSTLVASNDAGGLSTSEQLRAARALVRWEQRELAERSGVSLPTIKRLEARPGLLNAHRPTVLALERALEARGVAFVTTNAVQGVTVRWQDSHAEAPTT